MTWNESSHLDPHVKIVGKPEDVEAAKQMILEVLDTKQKNRVTLKMDVSHSDHSYIIGKGGFKIQQVMEETGCHIHFPDSNRNSNAEKSNQVSIAGEADGVEVARNKIRDLLPLVYMFELPAGIAVSQGEESDPVLQHIQQTYSFTLNFKSMAPGQVLVVVRGCHRLLQRLRHGLIVLMEFLTGTRTVPTIGVMKTEIAAQHHAFVMGVNGINVQMIMNKTGATICFPDPAALQNPTLLPLTQPPLLSTAPLMYAPNIPQVLQTKTSVIIKGSFDSVCAAWDDLLKALPLALMFDLKEGQDVDPMLINRLMEENNINITVRPKIRENIKSVIIRGVEKDSKILFETRKEILGIQECARPLNSGLPYVNGLSQSRRRRNSAPDEPVPPNVSTADSIAFLKNYIHQHPDVIGALTEFTADLHTPQMANAASRARALRSAMPENLRVQNPSFNGQVNAGLENLGAWSKVYGNGCRQKNGYYGRNFQDLPPFLPPPFVQKGTSSPGSEDCDSGYFSHKSRHFNGSSQPGSSASSTASSLCNESLEASGATNRRFFQLRNLQNEKETASNFGNLVTDYESKKITATKAMYEDICGTVRVPNDAWSGYGFSKSMPESVLKGKMPKSEKFFSDVELPKFQHNSSTSDSSSEYHSPIGTAHNVVGLSDQACAPSYSNVTSPSDRAMPSPFTLSNFWETLAPVSTVNPNCFRDLQQLLTYFNLEQYMDLFVQQEIDLAAFLMLTDCDLQQLNISYTVRRRMLNAIAAMRESKKQDFPMPQFRAAPGAERKQHPLFSRMSTSDA